MNCLIGFSGAGLCKNGVCRYLNILFYKIIYTAKIRRFFCGEVTCVKYKLRHCLIGRHSEYDIVRISLKLQLVMSYLHKGLPEDFLYGGPRQFDHANFIFFQMICFFRHMTFPKKPDN